MRKTSSPILLTAVGLFALAAGVAPATAPAAHRGIELRTFASGAAVGETIVGGLDFSDTLPANGDPEGLVAGPPMSPKQSCNQCHVYEAITSAYHFQLGLDERIDLDGDGFQDDLGQLLVAGDDGQGGVLETLPTLYNVNSPGQFGAW